ncbi:MAG: bifunctional methylenetetrahydrofolate dehydrogenase/methenyltetrahydrofolate cyclohydrolase FolD [Anaerolineae bacterium]|jgi:5,10-methylene-tetrahydrofolate dehydrogenase/methenyl tetrahydrofolate cyclohydrolase|nr:bifunctional methylenetetrahydrofolate dehydrogenase/methenyltetrahydrofolate cyclohydrolase FolD [Anaerolineae bacterium]
MPKARLIDGKATAEQIRLEVKKAVENFILQGNPAPGLATVLVGDDIGSKTYIRMKRLACEEVGIFSQHYDFPSDVQQEEIVELVRKLNHDSAVSGILVQLPLPGPLDEEKILAEMSLSKDVDGFHPINIGRLAQKGRTSLLNPCTPKGIIYLLEKELGELAGKNAVVIGRSNIVGMPTALMLMKADATVTICHSHSRDVPGIVRDADILVSAVGKANFVQGDWIKPGAVVIDVGINRVDDPTRKRGYRLVGDVNFDEVCEIAGAITPVPGGVGPMTIAMLMQNTLIAAQNLKK